jgi:NTE family protein
MADIGEASGARLSAIVTRRVARTAFASIAAPDPEPAHMPSRYALLAICAAILALPAIALPADGDAAPTAGERPRIGLVLSGGGARGAAHVGVIRALEKMRIPVDAVAGTSMGAVVGGLYAAGLSGDEIEAALRALDWQELLRDRAPRRDLVFRRKQDDRSILAKGALGFRAGEGVVLPLGLVQGQKITQALRAATLRVAEVQDFDRLPIPFRALATDLETGEPVVLRSGDLATVLRASMSAPGLLAPVEIDGRMLVDGGLVDNLPVSLARAMGVDVLIAVDVSFPLTGRDGLESALDVTNQMIGIMVRRGTRDSRALLTSRDVLVEPDLGRMTAVEFTRVPQVMAAGEMAADAVRGQLAALSQSPAHYAEYVVAHQRSAYLAEPLAFVRAGPKSQDDADRIEAVFGSLAGQPLDLNALQRKIGRQYGLDRFESVDYRLVRDDRDLGLEIDMRRKSWGPNFLRLGVGLEQDFDGGATANAGVRVLMTSLNRYDAEWLVDGQLGEDPKFFTEFFQPLSLTSDVFVAPSLRYEYRTLQVVDDGRRIARYRTRESEAALALGAELSNWGEVRFGLARGDGSADVLVGDPGLPQTDVDLGAAFFEFAYDRLDSAYFPKHGQSLRLAWRGEREGLGSSGDTDVLRAEWLMARSQQRYSLVLGLEGGSALDDAMVSPQQLFTLGGFLKLSGLPVDARAGTQYGLARAILYRRVSRGGTGFFEFPAYLGVSLEAGNTWLTRDDIDWSRLEAGGSLFLGAESPFGPVYLAAGFGEDGARAFYLLLGRTF